MEEKEHSKQRKQLEQGFWDGGPLEVFGKSKETSMSGDQVQRGNEIFIRQGPVAMVTALTFTLNELGNQWGFLQQLSDGI